MMVTRRQFPAPLPHETPCLTSSTTTYNNIILFILSRLLYDMCFTIEIFKSQARLPAP